MKIKSVIFDLDGTLIDSIHDIADSCNVILEKHGFETHSVDLYIKWIGEGAKLLIERALPESTDKAVVEQLLEEYIPLYRENSTVKTVLFPGIDEVLDFMVDKGIVISILTNKPHVQTVKIVDYYLSKWPFNFVFGQRDNVPKKPDPGVALQIASRTKAKPNEVLFIGDSKTDIKTAIAANMHIVGVTWGYGTIESMKQAGCNEFVSTAEELLKYIKENL